ncbi:hypothetical protein GWI33_009433, partial [Rhynchophorus ferrugineus]
MVATFNCARLLFGSVARATNLFSVYQCVTSRDGWSPTRERRVCASRTAVIERERFFGDCTTGAVSRRTKPYRNTSYKDRSPGRCSKTHLLPDEVSSNLLSSNCPCRSDIDQ